MSYREPFANAIRIAREAVASGAHPSVVLAVAGNAGEAFQYIAPGSEGATAETIYPIASITKPILGTAIMQLAEEGRLFLSSPVSRYVPEFATNGKEQVTVWHLLTHTSGLVEDEERIGGTFVSKAPASEWLQIALDAPLAFAPGTHYAYCTQAFCVLAEIVTRLSGVPYDQYLRERIFSPLEMTDTWFSPTDRSRAATVHGFWEGDGQAYFDSIKMPGGGLWSTAADLIAFGRTFLRAGRPLLGRAACEAMTRLSTVGISDTAGAPAYRGLTWQKPIPAEMPFSSPGSFGHGGATGTLLWIDPERDLVFVWLSGRWGVDFDYALRALNSVTAELSA